MPARSSAVSYTATPLLRHPADFVRGMARDLGASRHLAWQLLIRNLRAQYRQSLLGFAWAVAPPLTTTLVWIFLRRSGVIELGTTPVPYPVYVLTGSLLWQTFVDALNSPLGQVAAARGLIGKISFPREALILAGLGEVLFNAAIRFGVILAILPLFHMPFPPTLLLAPAGVLGLVALGLAIGLLLAPIGMLYTDVQRALGIATTLWFFLTPVVYVSAPGPRITGLLRINPVTPLLVTAREWLTAGHAPPPPAFLLTFAGSLVILLVGWGWLRLSLPHVVARWSER
jgi:lipopolysaccharide transport system permease protein